MVGFVSGGPDGDCHGGEVLASPRPPCPLHAPVRAGDPYEQLRAISQATISSMIASCSGSFRISWRRRGIDPERLVVGAGELVHQPTAAGRGQPVVGAVQDQEREREGRQALRERHAHALQRDDRLGRERAVEIKRVLLVGGDHRRVAADRLGIHLEDPPPGRYPRDGARRHANRRLLIQSGERAAEDQPRQLVLVVARVVQADGGPHAVSQQERLLRRRRRRRDSDHRAEVCGHRCHGGESHPLTLGEPVAPVVDRPYRVSGGPEPAGDVGVAAAVFATAVRDHDGRPHRTRCRPRPKADLEAILALKAARALAHAPEASLI